jgi:hypothetical protein
MSHMKDLILAEDAAFDEWRASADASPADVSGVGGNNMVATLATLIPTGNEAVPATDPVPVEDPVLAYVGKISLEKHPHGALILDGVCSHCAHCGMSLTDAVSIQRGIGPVCSKKGYHEDPQNADEMQAMISLAEFPEVCQFLVEHYRPQGVRGLCNGLVRLASLNRGNYDLHVACCDAIECLGYLSLSNLLRESISIIQLKDSEQKPGCLEVWVKKHAFKWAWANDLRKIPGQYVDRDLKRVIIPVKDSAGNVLYGTFEGRKMSNRQMLWELMLRHYQGFCGKIVGKGGFKILPKARPASEPPPAPAEVTPA